MIIRAGIPGSMNVYISCSYSKIDKCLHLLSECYGVKIQQQLIINQYKRTEHSIGVVMLHPEWCTKYRYKIFRKTKYKIY